MTERMTVESMATDLEKRATCPPEWECYVCAMYKRRAALVRALQRVREAAERVRHERHCNTYNGKRCDCAIGPLQDAVMDVRRIEKGESGE